jgi:hypothetical protein
MELEIILKAETLELLEEKLAGYFGTPMRIIREDVSIFEQYAVRPVERVHVPGVWKYRVICKGGIYYFGRV